MLWYEKYSCAKRTARKRHFWAVREIGQNPPEEFGFLGCFLTKNRLRPRTFLGGSWNGHFCDYFWKGRFLVFFSGHSMGRGENKHEKVPANLRGEAVFRVHSMGRDQKVLPKIRWATCFYFVWAGNVQFFSSSESPGNRNFSCLFSGEWKCVIG